MPDIPSTVERDACQLVISGEVDIAVVDLLLAEAQHCLEDGSSVIEIDLGAVTFIDSSGLGALVQIRNEAIRRNLDMVLLGVPASVRRLFEVSGLDQVFLIQSDG